MLGIDASALAVAAAVLLAVRCASAISGVVEISQASVLKDGGRFPYTITAPGSYRLTSNLDVTADTGNNTAAEDRDAIVVYASDVVIDLNGFAILGPLVCSNTPPGCTPFRGSGQGVTHSSYSLTNITVRNGSVRGMGGDGVDLGLFDGTARVEHVHASSNGGTGIQAGVFPGFGAYDLLSSCYSRGNDGIQAEYLGGNNGGGVVSGSTLLGGNIAAYRGGYLFTENVLARSSSVFPLSEGAPAIEAFSTSAYRRNLLASPVDPVIRGGATQLGLNLCNGDTVCP